MDAVFRLGPDYRRVFLRAAARRLSCAYVALWAPLDQYSSRSIVRCLDGVYLAGVAGVQALFDGYCGSVCRVVAGCVPGWAYGERLPFVELAGAGLVSSAALQVQQQFYLEAGITLAVFAGSSAGEIEVGIVSPAAAIAPASLQQVFSEDFIQQAMLEELLSSRELPVAGLRSSSSSPLPSISVGSEDYSSQELPLLNVWLAPTAESADAAIARAMHAVISSNVIPSSSSLPPPPPRAFKAYDEALRPRAVPTAAAATNKGQQAIKKALAMLQKMEMRRRALSVAAAAAEDTPAPPPRYTSSQLHHMIAERQRREKLNESFQALRTLLPPGSKKDKATVLARTRAHLSALQDQVAELQEKNRELEARLGITGAVPPAAIGEGRIEVRLLMPPSSSTAPVEPRRLDLQVAVRVDIVDLEQLVVRTIGCLKQFGGFTLVAVNAAAATGAPPASALTTVSISLQTAGNDWDESAVKEAVTAAVEEAVAASASAACLRPPPSP